MAVPARRRIRMYRGDDFRYSFRVETYIDPEDPSAGKQPRDLTNWTATVTTNPAVAATVSGPLDATGVVTVDVPAEDLGDGQDEEVELDVQLTDPAGFRRTYVYILLILVPQVVTPA